MWSVFDEGVFMKVTIVSNFDLETGRGPVFRLANILPYLSEKVELSVISLQEPDSLSAQVFDKSRIKYNILCFETNGWNVENSALVASNISQMVVDLNADLCVLGWEYWDICIELNKELHKTNCRFAVVFHSIPFVDALPFPKGYKDDIQERIDSEKNIMIRDYIKNRSTNAEDYIRDLNIISINETVSFYLEHYFPSKSFYKANPGYALDMDEIMKVESEYKEYSFVYMSKLEYSKGIFDLLCIAEELKKTRPEWKLLVIGDFLYEKEKLEFLSQLKYKDLENTIVLAGWLSGKEKYKALKKGRVFLYPSLTGDTFSFCLLEALACGMEVICYDTPFSRIIYSDAPVRRAEYKNYTMFAKMAIEELYSASEVKSKYAVDFVRKKYSDWKKVADAEVLVYEQLCNG